MRLLTLILAYILFGCAAQTPNVRQGEPGQSFFNDQVTYPYRVKYSDARAGNGTVWKIGYMDVAPMFKPNPKVLVLIHGRSFSGAYFGHTIRIALKHGIRVVVPDEREQDK
jgi:pimeloyl-ACP methyl ester carboxylesterase